MTGHYSLDKSDDSDDEGSDDTGDDASAVSYDTMGENVKSRRFLSSDTFDIFKCWMSNMWEYNELLTPLLWLLL